MSLNSSPGQRPQIRFSYGERRVEVSRAILAETSCYGLCCCVELCSVMGCVVVLSCVVSWVTLLCYALVLCVRLCIDIK